MDLPNFTYPLYAVKTIYFVAYHTLLRCFALIKAYIMINAEIGKIAKVVEELKKIDGIGNIAVVAGEFDIIVRVRVKSVEELFDITEKIHKIDGIVRTTTHVVEKEVFRE